MQYFRFRNLMLSSILGTCIIISKGNSQNSDDDIFFVKNIYEKALTEQLSYKWLTYLSETIGGRIAGSPQSMAAIEFTAQVLDTIGTDTVWRQACMVNYWYRGAREEIAIINHSLVGTRALNCLALGGSGATPKG
ncbi:MAG: hypothetical protein WBO31_02035, partial [Saprospiraceae bacterium]